MNILERSMAPSNQADPAKLRAAVHALRFALKYPVVSSQFEADPHAPASSNSGGKGVLSSSLLRPTAAYLNRRVDPHRLQEFKNEAKNNTDTYMKRKVCRWSSMYDQWIYIYILSPNPPL